MSTYQKCPKQVEDMAKEILAAFDTHQPLIDAGVTTDFVFAYGARNEAGELTGDAIMHHGAKALGLCKKVKLEDRVLGQADTRIVLDGDWWPTAPEDEQRSLLDHELHHIAVKIDKRGLVLDDIRRPVIQMRKHDIEVGWFKVIAARHGLNSQERIQARQLMSDSGQYFWPEIKGEPPPIEGVAMRRIEGTSVTISTGTTSVTLDAKAAEMLKKAAKEMRNK